MAPGMSELEERLKAMGSNESALEDAEAEVQVQVDRTIKILNNALRRLKIALCVPQLLENNLALLCKLLTVEEIQAFAPDLAVYTILESEPAETNRHTSHFYVSSVLSLEEMMKEYTPKRPSYGSRDHAKLCEILYFLLAKPGLVKMAEKRLMKNLSNAATLMVENMKELIRVINVRLRTTPEEEHGRDVELAKMFKEKEILEDGITRLKVKFDRDKEETHAKLKAMDIVLEEMSKEIVVVQQSAEEEIQKYTEDAEKQMDWDWRGSEYRQENIGAELKQTIANMELVLRQHQTREKDFRVKRYKAESQLIAILERYDNDKFERKKTLEELNKEHDEKNEKLRLMTEKFDEQEREFNFLMGEKADIERKEFEAQLYIIQCSIAARKIQRYFRYFLSLQRQFGKPKKGKKGKGKKKK